MITADVFAFQASGILINGHVLANCKCPPQMPDFKNLAGRVIPATVQALGLLKFEPGGIPIFANSDANTSEASNNCR